MKSRTEKLPKGRSYPLKPSLLESAVADGGLELPVELTRWDYKRNQTLEATFQPEASKWFEVGFRVTCGAAPSDRMAKIRAALESDGVPKFIRWAKEIGALDVKSPRRRERQYFKWEFPEPEA